MGQPDPPRGWAGPKSPCREDDNDSVVSVASSNARVAKPEGDTDSDASVASEGNTTTEVVDLVTDEDESDEESEEDFELSEKEQRFLQEAYDILANTGDAWTQQRATSAPSCRTPLRMPAMCRRRLKTSLSSRTAGPS